MLLATRYDNMDGQESDGGDKQYGVKTKKALGESKGPGKGKKRVIIFELSCLVILYPFS
jgi:hypothetical protein